MSVAIIDYGMSNLGSIYHAIEECGGQVSVVTEPFELKKASHIILPGVGSFGDGMANLNAQHWSEALHDVVTNDHTPLLGICLGMQLLATIGFEGGTNSGLNLIAGEVKKFISKNPQERIPHVGWNEVYLKKECPLMEGIPDGTDFYFVHSYHFVVKDATDVIATTPYCNSFNSVIQHGNIFGVQFHPEKSQRPGFQLLKNFLNI